MDGSAIERARSVPDKESNPSLYAAKLFIEAVISCAGEANVQKAKRDLLAALQWIHSSSDCAPVQSLLLCFLSCLYVYTQPEQAKNMTLAAQEIMSKYVGKTHMDGHSVLFTILRDLKEQAEQNLS